MNTLRFHNSTDIFPEFRDDGYVDLPADIKKHGLREPIMLHPDGSILDGRARYKACKLLGIEPKFRTWSGRGSEREYVFSLNLHRRHLTATQKACLSAEIESQFATDAKERQRGGRGGKLLPPNLGEAKGEALKKAAAFARSSHGYAALAKKLKQERPNLYKKMYAGEIDISEARAEFNESKREQMREANRKLVEQTAPPPAQEKYSTIVIDPPWDYESEGFKNRRVSSVPYACMSIDQISALPVDQLAETNSHLYLWTTNLFLPRSFALLDAWGFKYTSLLTWFKPRPVLSHWFNNQTEHVIFAVRGSLPLSRRDATTAIEGDCPRVHSAKPESFYKLVESCSPGVWLEMFARGARAGWVAWGAEVGSVP